MNWKIVPYESVGPLKFGMTPAEVAEHLGPPETVEGNPIPAGGSQELKDKYAGYTIEFRIGTGPETIKPTVHYADGKMVAVDVQDVQAETELDGFRLFEHSKREALQKLKRDSKFYAEEFDGFVFFDFGISISNDDMWEESPPINVFAKGQFDDLLESADEDEEIKIVRR